VRVLLAEDDAGLRDALGRGLRENGYVVDAVPDGGAAVSYLRAYEYEIAILDWRMPILSGIEVLQQIRRRQLPTAVLMLTARDTPQDRVAGLDQGADDYMVKPFDIAEFYARLRALQRRPAAVQQPQLVVGDLVFDPATRTVRVGDQSPVLTATEFGILEMLVRRSPAVVARRSIAMGVWDDEADALGSNTIDVHLARLRSKLAGGMVSIETVRGVGYRIVGR
jgi:DNA-binding response OmpR family regulator